MSIPPSSSQSNGTLEYDTDIVEFTIIVVGKPHPSSTKPHISHSFLLLGKTGVLLTSSSVVRIRQEQVCFMIGK